MDEEKKVVYMFKPEEEGLIRKAIVGDKNDNKNSSSAKTSKIDRKKRTEKFLNNLSKFHSKQEIEQIRRIMESVSDEEFEMLCNQADAMTNALLGDDHDFNLD